MSAAAAVVVLLLQPVLEADGPLRLVAADVGDAEVVWSLDGVEVARTGDREAAVIEAVAGEHELHAASAASGPWTAMARPDGSGSGATFVPAWVAVNDAANVTLGPRTHAGSRGVDVPLPPLPIALGLAALLAAAWPGRSGLEALRRLRRR